MEVVQLVNQGVIHKEFGKGIICSVEKEKYLNVKFKEKDRMYRFVYPQCFYGFLMAEDKKLQSDIDEVVKIWKQEAGILKKEELRHRQEKTMRAIKRRKMAAETKKLRESQRALERQSKFNHIKQKKS